MIGAMQSMPTSGMSGLQGPKGGPPPPPPPSEDELIDGLQEAIEAGEIDLEALDATLTERFGPAASGIVSDSGEVDYEALSSLMVEAREEQMREREERMMANLTGRFGEDAAASVLGDDGEIDHEAVRNLFAENGETPPPPPGGRGGGPGGGVVGAYGATGGQSSPLIDFLA